MANKELSMIDLVIETHAGLERQGPGSPEMTLKALSFLDNPGKNLQIADLGCGSGGQTMVLAQNLSGNIIGVDLFPDFINILNDNAKKTKPGGKSKRHCWLHGKPFFPKRKIRPYLVGRCYRQHWF